MASRTIAATGPPPPSAPTAPQSQTQNHTARLPFGRGQGRGNAGATEYRGGRGRGRGQRGSRGRGTERPQSQNGASNQAPALTPQAGPGLEGPLSAKQQAADSKNVSTSLEKTAADDNTEEVEAEVCFICASDVIHNSIAPCNHRTCHICALRLRALYKTRACAHCRTEAKFVIFTDDANKRYENFVDSDFQTTDDVLGIKYEHKEIHDDTVLLLRYNCPADDCDVACWGWPDLHRHVKGVHHKILCDLCTRNKKVFTHEHELFTPQELRKHEKFGDDNPGAVDQSGFKGHPQCGFCTQRFYGDDELYAHCRDKHERCHICDRRNQGRQQQYYLDYNALEEHFRSDHFLCADQECIDQKFVVFESEIDLKAHQLEVHPNGLTKDARRDARRVDMSGFDLRSPHQENIGGRREREGRGRGRGRDPNTEALPLSTAQPMRRDEVAYQRQMAIQNASAAMSHTPASQARSTGAYAARPTGRAHDTVSAHRPPTANAALDSAIGNLQLSSEVGQGPDLESISLQEQARQLQHAALVERASAMLHGDRTKISDFRTSVSSYKTSKITAQQLIDTFFTLFDVPTADVGKLVKELAELYENESKRSALLKAWNDWRAINEDYPSLPGPSGVLPGSSAAGAGSGGKRILKLKSSTAQSSRSAVSRQGSWGKVIVNNNNNPFPAIASTGSRTGLAAAAASVPRGHAPAWVSSTSSSASSRPAAPSTTRPIATTRPANVPSSDAFPALPAAAKPNTLMMGLTRGSVRWDDNRSGNSTPAINPWGGTTSTNPSSSSTAVPGVEAEDFTITEGGKKKGNKGKKQTLYKFG